MTMRKVRRSSEHKIGPVYITNLVIEFKREGKVLLFHKDWASQSEEIKKALTEEIRSRFEDRIKNEEGFEKSWYVNYSLNKSGLYVAERELAEERHKRDLEMKSKQEEERRKKYFEIRQDKAEQTAFFFLRLSFYKDHLPGKIGRKLFKRLFLHDSFDNILNSAETLVHLLETMPIDYKKIESGPDFQNFLKSHSSSFGKGEKADMLVMLESLKKELEFASSMSVDSIVRSDIQMSLIFVNVFVLILNVNSTINNLYKS